MTVATLILPWSGMSFQGWDLSCARSFFALPLTGSQGECDGQSMAHAAWITRVGDAGEALQQPRHFSQGGRAVVAESVKGGRDRGRCPHPPPF